MKVKVQIGIFKRTGIMGQDLVYPYIQSTTVLCDIFFVRGLVSMETVTNCVMHYIIIGSM